ncbi:hypothetical protein [Actinomyces radicidentis]|uniref:AbiEi antitoxin C-terminal domain-containing protein n=1 Tax=Actinomyces radicidentis TaxID=111015 RepID=A0A0X8JFW6_ACTRD|nr:hypothetical protein [Actinomyces radicidentis]AMD87881.1 hypothetical protein AXF14_10205 [Actinomyces radicidentis]
MTSPPQRAPAPRVPAPRVMDRLLRPAPPSATSPLSDDELALLRVPVLDTALLERVAGLPVPRDLLRSPVARARCVADHVPADGALVGLTALWVHDGRRSPAGGLEVSTPSRSGGSPRVRLRRGALASEDLVLVGGLRCAAPARAAVDAARTSPPAVAVEAVLRALALGESRASLLCALDRCRGGSARGRPRAQSLITALA